LFPRYTSGLLLLKEASFLAVGVLSLIGLFIPQLLEFARIPQFAVASASNQLVGVSVSRKCLFLG
jgi:hypothetical protein